jgi:hypothetical protein
MSVAAFATGIYKQEGVIKVRANKAALNLFTIEFYNPIA